MADFDLHLIAGVPYSKIKNANLANDVITLCTSDSKQITASFAVPRPSAGLAFVGDFLHFTVDAATKTDEVVSEMRGNRRTQAFNEKQKAANDFIFDIFNLLTQVIES